MIRSGPQNGANVGRSGAELKQPGTLLLCVPDTDTPKNSNGTAAHGYPPSREYRLLFCQEKFYGLKRKHLVNREAFYLTEYFSWRFDYIPVMFSL